MSVSVRIPGRPRNAEPQTIVGQWLLAMATPEGAASRTELGRRLNGGRPGFNDDEPAVLSSACHLALVRLRERRGDSAPWELVEAVMRITPESRRPSRQDAGATAAASLIQPIVKVDGLNQGQVFSIQLLLFSAACRSLRMTQLDASQLIRDAEEVAVELAFSPPLTP